MSLTIIHSRDLFAYYTIPWEQRKFGELAEYKKGPFGSAITKDMFVPKNDHSVKVYEQQNAINKDWRLERYFLPKEYVSTKLKSFETHGGDIIVSCAGTIGEIYEIPENAESGVINQALMRVRVNDAVADKRMFIIAFSNMIDSFTKVHSNGSAIKNIPPFADLKPMEVLMPSIEEQRKISAYFYSIDNLITLHQRKHFQDRNNSFPFKNALAMASFTATWEQRKLEDIFTERHILSKITEEYPRLSFTIEEGVIHPEDRKTNKRDFLMKDESNKKFLVTELEDIIYNPANVVWGALHRNTYGKGCLSPIYKIFSTYENPAFIECILRSPSFIRALSQKTEGTVVKLKTLKPEAFLEMSISVAPQRAEQDAIAAVFEQIDNLITLHQRNSSHRTYNHLSSFEAAISHFTGG